MSSENDILKDLDLYLEALGSELARSLSEVVGAPRSATSKISQIADPVAWPAGCLVPRTVWGASRADLVRWAGLLEYLTHVFADLVRVLFPRRAPLLHSWSLGLLLGLGWEREVRHGVVGVADFIW